MIVKRITPQGFCKGVYRAIDLVKKAIVDPKYPKPIYVLGYIVHNKKVVDELKDLGVISLDDSTQDRSLLVDQISDGTVVLSAHGTDLKVIAKLKQKGLAFIDATCPDVYRTHDLIKTYLDQGYQVLYIGKKGHPETIASTSISKQVHLIETKADLTKLPRLDKVFVTNQTTFSIMEISDLHQAIREMYPDAMIAEEICNATRLRQKAIIAANKDVDLCYIVGDPRSNNTRNLVKISREETNTRTLLIRDVEDIDVDDLQEVKVVSVSSGASTPNDLTQAVVDFLKNYNN